VIGDPPDVLRDLIAAERTAPVVNDAMRTVIRAKLSSTLGIAGTAASASVGIKLLGIAIGIVGVVGVASHVTRSEVAAAPVITHVSSAPIEPPQVDVVAEVAVAAPPIQPSVARKPARVAQRTQVALLAEATRALSDGDALRVLALVDEDLRAHRDAPLAEEREALRISALLALHRTSDARAVATRFLSRFPHTSHRALVERAIAQETP
jgi:hypothetical protein